MNSFLAKYFDLFFLTKLHNILFFTVVILLTFFQYNNSSVNYGHHLIGSQFNQYSNHWAEPSRLPSKLNQALIHRKNIMKSCG